MRITFVNAKDVEGGATRAALRLGAGLTNAGAEITLMVQQRTGTDRNVVGPASKLAKVRAAIRPTLDRLPLEWYPNRQPGVMWGVNWLPNRDFALQIASTAPDIVHVHWVGDGFVPLHTIASLRKPLVLTLHDMWAFTGGCHYDGGCGRFAIGCGQCPVLGSSAHTDLSSRSLRRKTHALRERAILAIAPSHWIAGEARRSLALATARIEVVPNALDTSVFKPIDKAAARNALGIPQGKKVVLFGAFSGTGDKRKGYVHLVAALRQLYVAWGDSDIHLATFGGSKPLTGEELPFPVTHIGRLHDDVALALAYSAADVMVTPSLQEVFGQTASEALACGTPVVAFARTGVADIVTHEVDGYLANMNCLQDLSRGIAWVLGDTERWQALSIAARKSSMRFELKTVASQHLKLFDEALSLNR